MIFFYTDCPKVEYINKFKDKENVHIINNVNSKFYFKNKFVSVSYKQIYKNFKQVPYKKIYDDFKFNVLFSTLCYTKELNTKDLLEFIFICQENNNFLECVDSLLKRRKIIKQVKDKLQTDSFALNTDQIQEILKLAKFLLKTKVVTKDNNFFDFVYNYYFYLNKN
jgi:hypothetical protein